MTAQTYSCEAYAKINLYLDITGRRPDGYHELLTVFQEVSLADHLRLSIRPSSALKLDVSCSDTAINPLENLVYKAAQRFMRFFAHKAEISIELLKRIPSGAGLGGGSSDAAAVLKLLAAHYAIPLNHFGLHQLARSLGADVPFFLKGKTALATGIGDILEPVQRFSLMNFVLIFPNISVPTAKVYSHVKSLLTDFPEGDIKNVTFLRRDWEPYGDALYNRLEDVCFDLFPQLKKIKQLLFRLSGRKFLMSGSGSSFFTLVSDSQSGHDLLSLLKAHGYEGAVVSSVC